VMADRTRISRRTVGGRLRRMVACIAGKEYARIARIFCSLLHESVAGHFLLQISAEEPLVFGLGKLCRGRRRWWGIALLREVC
jgi:hypothetical protein